MVVSTGRTVDSTGHASAAPLTKSSWLRLVGAGITLYLGLAAVGLAITHLLAHTWLLTADQATSRWFLARRTPLLDTLTHIGTELSDTPVAIALTVLLVPLLRWWLGRWRESLAVLVAILGELFVFLLVTNTVDRPRPPVPRLDVAPPTSSFPSGHTAAAVALYGCVALVLLRQLAVRWVARLVAVLCFGIPVVVGLSRVYRGMHYPSDVLFGALGGGIWLVVTVLVVLPAATYGRRAVTDRPG
jgi:undecaprenyl-diphosphatase